MNEPVLQSDSRPMPVNDLATAYQPRRVAASAICLIWNLLIIVVFISTHGPRRLEGFITHHRATLSIGEFFFAAPTFAIVCFAGHALLNYPVELWFGYLQERQFGLAKDGIRSWTIDWLHGVSQHGMQFVVGAVLILTLLHFCPVFWLPWLALGWMVLFCGGSYFAFAMIPRGLFHFEVPDENLRSRLQALVEGGRPRPPKSSENTADEDLRPPEKTVDGYTRPIVLQSPLPPIMIFSAPAMRDFTGGIIGLANQKKLLLSRSTVTSASDNLLHFILLHELGHVKYHHTLLSTLAGWAWAVIGLIATEKWIAYENRALFGQLAVLVWMALGLSLWMAMGEPILAFFGRRLEYQADRY